MTRKPVVIGVALLLIAFAAACSKGPAEAALKAADAAVQAAEPDASKYVPEQFTALSDSLKAARDKFDAGDYAGALADAKDIPAKAGEIAQAAAAKKEEMTKAWAELQGGLPGLVEAVQGKLAELGKARRLPKGLDKAKVEEMTGALPQLTATWTEAVDAANAGNVPAALEKAGQVKTSVMEMMQTLGIEAPAAADAAPEPGQ